MLLPYVSAVNYLLWAVPQFEWQPEPEDPAQTPAIGEGFGTCADPAAPAATMECGNTGNDAAREAPLPRLRLVMTGVHWVAVPYWTQRENPQWESIVQDGRDEDKRRTEASALQAKRRLDAGAGVEELQPGKGT